MALMDNVGLIIKEALSLVSDVLHKYGLRDRIRLNEVRTFLDAASPQETHLVLSMTSHPKTLAGVVEFYRPFSPDRVILSKIDECMSPGVVLDALERALSPIIVTQVARPNPVPLPASLVV